MTIPEELKQDPTVAAVVAAFPNAVEEASNNLGELTLVVAAGSILDVCRLLKNDQKYVRLSGVTAVDWHPREPRFEVVYLMQSIQPNRWLRVKCRLAGDKPEIDSVYSVWRGSDWYERETFDLFGIVFKGHPDLKRIMMPEDWQGHPLRKDYPVHGYKYSYADPQ
ncbi:MAG: NADH-quinone oxidoreductase subunit C [Candidatus Solibacter usitatus]|nr:NADH-quinone oxidoreductase subunit C [Candidatus Solibacter usitatus]